MTTLRDQAVLVAGATGFVGTNLVRALVERGARVRGTVHRRPALVHDPRVEYVPADLTQAADCRRVVEGQRVVFMCAGNTSGAAIMAATPMAHVTPNVIMNSLMLEAAYAAGIQKFVWLSSTTGYPPTGERPVREDEMFEGDPYDTYYFVGWMKRFTEILCRMYGERLTPRMVTVVLRPTNIYGPHDDFEPATSHVTPALLRKVVERSRPLEVWGTGDDVRDVIYVDDMVRAMLLAAERVERHVAINVGLGRTHSVKEILRLLLELDGYESAEVVFNLDRPRMIPARSVDLTLAERELGFRATVDLKEGLSRTLRWYRAQRQCAG